MEINEQTIDGVSLSGFDGLMGETMEETLFKPVCMLQNVNSQFHLEMLIIKSLSGI